MPMPILALDPSFFPGTTFYVETVPAGTTAADMPTWIENNFPSEKGGDTDNFKVIETGTLTLDTGVTSPYLIYTGTKMGYSTEDEFVFLVSGTQAFMLAGDDYIPTFSDSRALLEQVIKTFHFTS
jgi:hypothetical protein